MSDFDLLTKFMKVSEDEAEKIIARNKIQKLEDLKIQIIGQNPQLLGVGTPGSETGEPEMGTEAGGPTANLEDQMGGAPQGQDEEVPPDQGQEDTGNEEKPTALPDPSEEDIKKYDLGMEDYSKTIDGEDIDWSEEG
jgi:hypothetical protein